MSEKVFPEAVVDFVTSRKRAYMLMLGGDRKLPHVAAVMEDLEAFCRYRKTTFHADARIHAALEGRREVILRIRDHLDLSVEELCNKYHGDK